MFEKKKLKTKLTAHQFISSEFVNVPIVPALPSSPSIPLPPREY